MKIESFRGGYSFLSNFVGSIFINGKLWPTVEHAYQAAKTLNPLEQEAVRCCTTPGKAKRMGRKVTLRADFDAHKQRIMEKLVRMKFVDSSYQNLSNFVHLLN